MLEIIAFISNIMVLRNDCTKSKHDDTMNLYEIHIQSPNKISINPTLCYSHIFHILENWKQRTSQQIVIFEEIIVVIKECSFQIINLIWINESKQQRHRHSRDEKTLLCLWKRDGFQSGSSEIIAKHLTLIKCQFGPFHYICYLVKSLL